MNGTVLLPVPEVRLPLEHASLIDGVGKWNLAEFYHLSWTGGTSWYATNPFDLMAAHLEVTSPTVTWMKLLASSAAFLLIGYVAVLTVALEGSRKTPARRQAWILTFLSALGMSVSSLPALLSFLLRHHLDVHAFLLDKHWHQQWQPLAEFTCSFFLAYLVLDLAVGWCLYRPHLNLLTGWLHHLFYLHVTLSILPHPQLHALFLLFASMEVPTFVLGLGSLWKPWRQDYVFGGTFFLFRIALHTVLLWQVWGLPSTQVPRQFCAYIVLAYALHENLPWVFLLGVEWQTCDKLELWGL